MATINPWINFNGNAEEADTIFNGLAAGGQVEMPMSQSAWSSNSYFGMLRDKYGIEWTVEFSNMLLFT